MSKGFAEIDWNSLHRRMAAVDAALAGERPEERAQALLASRAAALAQTHPQEEPESERLSVIEFEVCGERYAIETAFLRETFALADFTPLFCTPPFVLGITSLRGRIVSIIELTRFFGLPAVGLSNLNRVLVVGEGGMEFGIVADGIVGIRQLLRRELQASPATLRGIAAEFICGVTAESMALLDMKKILNDERIVVQEEVD